MLCPATKQYLGGLGPLIKPAGMGLGFQMKGRLKYKALWPKQGCKSVRERNGVLYLEDAGPWGHSHKVETVSHPERCLWAALPEATSFLSPHFACCRDSGTTEHSTIADHRSPACTAVPSSALPLWWPDFCPFLIPAVFRSQFKIILGDIASSRSA